MDVQCPEVERGEIIYKRSSRMDYSLDLDVDVIAVAVSVSMTGVGAERVWDAGGCLQAFKEWTVYSGPRSRSCDLQLRGI
jgi:hypothetical protein